MVGLLSVGLEEAEQATCDEVEGSCGPAQVMPSEAMPAALQQAAVVLQAEALAAASQVCFCTFMTCDIRSLSRGESLDSRQQKSGAQLCSRQPLY
jgi:hypothetical protein